MIMLKKLIFAPLFAVAFIILIYNINPLLKSYDFIFALSTDTLTTLIMISSLISLSSFLFVLFTSIALEWKIVVPLVIISCLFPLIFLEPALALVLGVGILVSLLLTVLSLDTTLKRYLNFQPSSLLGPPIRNLCGLLILSFCVVYFLTTHKIVAQEGFQIPDSIIDTALKFASPQGETTLAPQNLLKQAVKDQLQSFLKPYLGFIPAGLAILLFLTLQSLTSMINLLIYPLLWGTFYVLEKTGFVKFTTEMRTVKKMVL